MHKYHDIVLGSLEIGQSEAMKHKNLQLSPWHLLYGLVANPQSFASKAFKSDKKIIKNKILELPSSSKALPIDQLKTDHQLAEWITLASSHSIQAGRSEIIEADLLRFISQVLPQFDFNPEVLKEAGNGEEEVPSFLVNLNDLAANAKLDPVIGRTKEIRAVMEILGRRSKNNPVLVGSAGVGKTAIVEGLAHAIHKGNVPDVLKDKTVYSLDLGALMAGTKFRGEFEERIQKLISYITSMNGQAILFIDEIHQLVGAGKTDGAMDAANLLKPALARGELHAIGATTFDEYQKYILSDSALDRRFRSVPVREPSKEDAIEIMMGVKDKLEIHHGIKISDEAVFSSVFLSDQYMTDKNLPDKCIDLVDEAASALKLSAEAMPHELEELQSEIRAKKIYSKVEPDNQEIAIEIETLEEKFNAGKKKFDQEVLNLKQISDLKNLVDRHRFELEEAERNQNFEEASRLKYSVIPELEKELNSKSNNWVLGEEHIAQVISRQTGIPVEKITKSKQDHILGLEHYLQDRVFGQDEALAEISDALVAAHAGLSDPTKPLASFLLKGPSGVGKTETAKALTQYLFNSEKNLIRLDMSEFSEKHSVAKLIGAPAGYIGHDDGGVLTQAVRTRPYSVILFDEIEKAHPDFADILLQILDDGRLTDNKGRTIDFKNTVIFLTTNSKNPERDFKPEVLGRLDGHLEYKSLDKSIMGKLVQKQTSLLNERLKSSKAEITLNQDLIKELCLRGHDERYGARPLATLFNKLIVRPLSYKLLKGELHEGKIIASLVDGKVLFAAS